MLKPSRNGYGAALLALLLLSSLSACTVFTSQTSILSVPPPIVWQMQPHQSFASGPVGTFALEFVDFTPQQFRFYYAFKSPHQADLRVSASSSLAGRGAASVMALATTVQPLGQIGDYAIGVIHVEHINRAGQIISLAITPTVANAITWQLAPFKQLIVEPHAQTARGGIGIMAEGLPEVQWSGELEEQLASYVKVVIPGQPVTNRTYVFVRSDDPVVVQVITKVQFIAIAGSANFTP
ncbi:MAG: hypothetical protein ABI068_11355 [Ktedonobacterales bacterium]